MNLQSIVITNCIGMFLTLIVIANSNMTRKGKDLDARLLTLLLLVSGSCCLMELFSFLADGRPSALCRFATWFTNTWIYLGNVLTSTLWLLYTDHHLHRKPERLTRIYRPHLILMAACCLVIIGNVFGHYLFIIDENNVYARLPASYSIYVVTLIMLISSVVEAIRYRRCHRIVIFFPLWTFLTPVLIGIVIQSLVYGVSLGWCCTAIGLASLYMSMQNELAYKDSLTGLHNRQYMDRILNTWNGRSGIMVDMDYFKEINDRFGHSVGDRALKDTADLLVANSPENSIVIRFAGDEFILLLSTGQEILIGKAEENIRKAADEFNRTADRPYKISLSMGHALYEKKCEDSFLEAMDSAMYKDKRIRHASGELRDRRQSARPEP